LAGQGRRIKLLYAPALVINDQTAKWLIFNHKAAFVCLFGKTPNTPNKNFVK
jgi:hypothetical protein